MRKAILCGMIGCGFVLVIAAVGCDERRAVAAEPTRTVRFTLAAYNVENYFDRHNDHYTLDETTEPKASAELVDLARAIRSLSADFVGVSEMENEGELYRFNHEQLADPSGAGKFDHVYVGHRDWGRGINNGALFNGQAGGVTVHRFQTLNVPGDERTWTFARDVIEVDWQPAEGVRVAVLVVHFKSKRDSDGDQQSTRWRTAEALAVRRIVEAKHAADPDALYAVVGDFNDTPGSAPMNALLSGGEAGGAGVAAKPRVLIDVMADVPPARKITYLKEPYRSTIDYILVSPALAEHLVAGSAKAGTQHLGGSDHAPVMATFVVPVSD